MRPVDAFRLIALGAIWGSSFLLIAFALKSFAGIAVAEAGKKRIREAPPALEADAPH